MQYKIKVDSITVCYIPGNEIMMGKCKAQGKRKTNKQLACCNYSNNRTDHIRTFKTYTRSILIQIIHPSNHHCLGPS